MRLIERLWTDDRGPATVVRGLLSPLSTIYRGIVATRGELFDKGVIASHESPIPVVSIGNVTVGGTGKTPVAAWVAGRLLDLGRKPAIVLRGYGSDEPLVHRRINPDVPVIVASDRVAGIRDASRHGADVAVLDDGFQHRRARRDVDLVLVSADDWNGRHQLLPAGPYREPIQNIERASAILITRKAVPATRVAEVRAAIHRIAPAVPTVEVSLALSDLRMEGDLLKCRQLASLRGKRVAAVAAVGNPAAFFQQLEAAGATVVRLPFPDHHPFTVNDINSILSAAALTDDVVCTLKDAVKLAALWPAGKRPLWYVSLAVDVCNGRSVIDDLLTFPDHRSI
ncbi:MAG: tetraacyldisaccharide 4'-kinase [Gemmatimonadaceae bacterium]